MQPNEGNNQDNTYGDVIKAQAVARVHRGLIDEYRLSTANPQMKPTDFSCESADNGSYRPYSILPLIIIPPPTVVAGGIIFYP